MPTGAARCHEWGGPVGVDGVTHRVVGRIAMDQMGIDLGGPEIAIDRKSRDRCWV
jgi:alanine racemase